jgi:hypothetical protein
MRSSTLIRITCLPIFHALGKPRSFLSKRNALFTLLPQNQPTKQTNKQSFSLKTLSPFHYIDHGTDANRKAFSKANSRKKAPNVLRRKAPNVVPTRRRRRNASNAQRRKEEESSSNNRTPLRGRERRKRLCHPNATTHAATLQVFRRRKETVPWERGRRESSDDFKI